MNTSARDRPISPSSVSSSLPARPRTAQSRSFRDDPAMSSAGSGSHTVVAPFAGVVVAIPHGSSEAVVADTPVVVLEAMKMEHEVLAGAEGVVAGLVVAVGDEV